MPFREPVLYRGRQKIEGIPICFNKVWLHEISNIQVLNIASKIYNKNKNKYNPKLDTSLTISGGYL